jgi:RHS repeat-associated protein
MTASNQFSGSGYGYDAAGNMTSQPGATYIYDAEDRLASTAGGSASYIYDASGKRVEKTVSGTWRDYVYDAQGNVVAEDISAGWQAGYVYLNGRMIVEYEYSTTYFVTGDQLGSSRLLTTLTGGVQDCNGFYPFGEQDPGICSSTNTTTHKFTAKERDSESGLDNFGARYDSSSMGRFMSPDVGAFHLENPQSLKRYAYALNNPLFYVDPDGEDSISAVYRLGTASVNTFVDSGQSLDNAAVLASFAGPSFAPLGNLEQDQSTISGGSGAFSRYIPFPNAGGGGCVLGCSTAFNEVPVGISLSLSFSYDDKTGQVTGANIQPSIDTSASFIGPNPSAQRAAFQALPGMMPNPEVFSVRIDPTVIAKLSSGQLSALFNAASKQPNAVRDAIRNAVIQEQQRRAEEQRKKDAERKEKCEQAGKKDCA